MFGDATMRTGISTGGTIAPATLAALYPFFPDTFPASCFVVSHGEKLACANDSELKQASKQASINSNILFLLSQRIALFFLPLTMLCLVFFVLPETHPFLYFMLIY